MISPSIYLAASYKRREEMEQIKRSMEGIGLHVTSRWVSGYGNTLPQHECAKDDIGDLFAADVVMLFGEHPDVGYMTGGRMVELGLAIAWQKKIWLIGDRENVFCYLPTISCYSSWQTALIHNRVMT